MLSWISTLGGLLIMMWQYDRFEAPFYYFRLEDQVPEHHLLRLIDRHQACCWHRLVVTVPSRGAREIAAP